MKNSRFARVPIWAFHADITSRALRVLGAICAHADPAGRAWPSLDTIAALSGVARNKIFAAIDELENAGLLHRDRATDGGRGNSTHYQVVFQGPETGPVLGAKQVPIWDPEQEEQLEQTLSAHVYVSRSGN
jgi:DNA-binding transcriptional MocR family regulator